MRRVALLRDNMRAKAISYSWHDAETSYIEAVLARGDRRLGRVIEQTVKDGGRLDSWGEFFSFERWMSAFNKHGISSDFYALRERKYGEVLPWSVTSAGVAEKYLWMGREAAYRNEITPDCRARCTGCGADRLNEGGVCDD